ncbi:hypothetical protein TSAR_007954 [Trichomalopsis sarcophagae]|uniref:Invertebrate defensins family profile domain-containing protein n=1 Tax=Trichomalopsis sarcophagae TaxID=543379 RepID=A0A232EKP9_9HYME|nr:hypothetical protein TSAR_007954 [Trichomalopsis sarcophagae]
MKLLLVVAFIAVAVTAGLSIPLNEFEDVVDFQDWDEAAVDEDAGVRQRRVTCDLLSFGGVVGDSACAANCLSMGKAGGRCNGGICECRKTTFKDLWDQRFG